MSQYMGYLSLDESDHFSNLDSATAIVNAGIQFFRENGSFCEPNRIVPENLAMIIANHSMNNEFESGYFNPNSGDKRIVFPDRNIKMYPSVKARKKRPFESSVITGIEGLEKEIGKIRKRRSAIYFLLKDAASQAFVQDKYGDLNSEFLLSNSLLGHGYLYHNYKLPWDVYSEYDLHYMTKDHEKKWCGYIRVNETEKDKGLIIGFGQGNHGHVVLFGLYDRPHLYLYDYKFNKGGYEYDYRRDKWFWQNNWPYVRIFDFPNPHLMDGDFISCYQKPIKRAKKKNRKGEVVKDKTSPLHLSSTINRAARELHDWTLEDDTEEFSFDPFRTQELMSGLGVLTAKQMRRVVDVEAKDLPISPGRNSGYGTSGLFITRRVDFRERRGRSQEYQYDLLEPGRLAGLSPQERVFEKKVMLAKRDPDLPFQKRFVIPSRDEEIVIPDDGITELFSGQLPFEDF